MRGILNQKGIALLPLLILGIWSFWVPSAHAVEPFCPGGTNPDPRIIFCEDWDGANPTLGFPNTRGTTWNGWRIEDTGDAQSNLQGYAELSTTVKHSGTRSFYQLKKANEHFVKDLFRTFPATTSIRIRFYIYFHENWSNIGSTNEPDDGVHFLFLQSTASGRGVRMDIYSYMNKTGTPIPNLVYAWPPTCVWPGLGSRPVFFNVGSPSGQGSTFKGVTQGRSDLCFNVVDNRRRWIPVEWAYKINNANDGRVSLWIDGVQKMNDELLPPDPGHMTIGNMTISGFMSWLRPYDLGFYMDDIVVANDYNFALGPTTAPPAAPVNLQVR